ncbi:hypothetical protein KIN20_015953 [Parelaphostrongylus tenuis]|uniref:Uncharacterized protein n=1 Tax=Parelaphostrongylus tenuis TaxID=148309 RepID=A0AAD5QQC0_PARTN|nr:hypothetical protein KIN20_015953 [Parelaphostrongylus tenuis]
MTMAKAYKNGRRMPAVMYPFLYSLSIVQLELVCLTWYDLDSSDAFGFQNELRSALQQPKEDSPSKS